MIHRKVLAISMSIVLMAVLASTGSAQNLLKYGGFDEYWAPASATLHTYNAGEFLGFDGDLVQATDGWLVTAVGQFPSGADTVVPLLSSDWPTGDVPNPDGSPWYMHFCDGGLAGCAVEQEFTTEVGNPYKLEFTHSDFGADEIAEMDINVGPVGGGSTYLSESVASTNWSVYEFNFTATDTDSVIEFMNTANGNNLDAVSITLIPEPSSLALLIFAAFGFCGWRRR